MRCYWATVSTLGLLALGAAPAQAAPCDKLSAKQKKEAQVLFGHIYPYDCCDETLDRCLKQKEVCKLARRLKDDICRRLSKGQDAAAITHALDLRARSMTPMGRRASFDLSGAAPAGPASARVQVVVYACARCPFCSRVVPDLYRIATSGGLKGKVKVYLRPFPIRGHAGSKEGGLAFVAAARLRKLWPFLNKLYEEYDRFAVARLVDWAVAVGMDRTAFEKEISVAANLKELVSSKKEGLRNGVKATPTVFINGRKYDGDLDHDTLVDILDEEADRIAGKRYCSGGGKDLFH